MNGALMGMTITVAMPLILWDRLRANSVSCAGVAGTAAHGTAVRRIATGALPAAATVFSASASLAPQDSTGGGARTIIGKEKIDLK